jgi:PAS domain S-box-containing protein
LEGEQMHFADLSAQPDDQYHSRILLVDEDEDDYRFILNLLSNAQEAHYRLQWASTFEAGRQALKTGSFDAVLMNDDLGAHTCVELIQEMVASRYPAPILLLSGQGHPEVDIDALRAGAADYLPRDELNPRFLERSIRNAIERKRMVEDLRFSETRFHQAFRASPNALLISRLEDSLIVEVNDSFLRLFDYSRVEVIGKTSHELNMFAHPADREKVIEQLRAGQSLRNFEIDIRTKTGLVLQANLSIENLQLENETLMLTILQDITERKQAEEALRQAHRQADWLARFPDENPNPVARVAEDGVILYRNSTAANPSGWALQVGQRLPDNLLPLVRKAIAQGMPVQADGAIASRFYTMTVMPFPSEGYVNLYAVDITERKQAEERMAEQARLLELVHDAILATDGQMMITYWNRAAEELYGWCQEDALGQNAAQLLQSGLAGAEREQALKQTYETGVYQGEVIHHTKDGRRLVIETRTLAQKDPSGQLMGYISANRDVTTRWQAEEALRESERKFSIIFEKSAFAGALSTLPNGKMVDVNEAWEKMLGYTRQESIGKTSLELGINPDAETRARLLAQLQERGSAHDLEMPIRAKSGEWRVG